MKISRLMILVLWCVVGTWHLSKGQNFAEREWHEGSLFLETDTLQGRLKYEVERETVMLEVGSQLLTFSARKVSGFQFYDKSRQTERLFYTLPFAKRGSYETPTFFELLLQGQSLSLFCREQLQTQSQTMMYPNAWGMGVPTTILTQSIKTQFYFLFAKTNKVKYFQGTKKHLLTLLPDQAPALKAYLQKNKVRFQQTEDMIQLISFYNSLKKK